MLPLHFYEAEVCGGIMVSVRYTCRTAFEGVIRKSVGYVAATASCRFLQDGGNGSRS